MRFGPFDLDTKAGELSKHGIRLRLQEQPLQLLVCLLENPGAFVSREELIRRIWADGTFVDYEHGLNAAVTRLRQIVRDSAENPRYIETVARRGYRFLAPVTEAPSPKAEDQREALRPVTSVSWHDSVGPGCSPAVWLQSPQACSFSGSLKAAAPDGLLGPAAYVIYRLRGRAVIRAGR